MKKVRVGVFTFHQNENPGSALQCYALQQALLNLKDNVELVPKVINYHKVGWEKEMVNAYGTPLLKNLISVWLRVHRWMFLSFQRKYIILNSKKKLHREDLDKIEPQYDKFIVGSDQVWNINNCKVDETYFLDFVKDKNKKVSYAASIGLTKYPSDVESKYADLLSGFGFLSVREKQAQQYIESILERNVELVLDPTFLIDAEKWNRIAKPPRRGGYIFLYLRDKNKAISSFAEKLSKKTGLKIIQVTGVRKAVKDAKIIHTPGPAQWLGLVAGAEYVVTDSFHGVALSINLHKNFYVKANDVNISMASRIYSILDITELNSRLIQDDFDNNDFDAIDFRNSDMKVAEMKENSLGFLKDALLK